MFGYWVVSCRLSNSRNWTKGDVFEQAVDERSQKLRTTMVQQADKIGGSSGVRIAAILGGERNFRCCCIKIPRLDTLADRRGWVKFPEEFHHDVPFLGAFSKGPRVANRT